jgi:hypothetical protein
MIPSIHRWTEFTLSSFSGGPEQFGLPPRPEVPTIYLRGAWCSAAVTSVLVLIGAYLAFALS